MRLFRSFSSLYTLRAKPLQKIEKRFALIEIKKNQKTAIEVWGGPAPIRSALAGGACHGVKA
jgi:hypothetical protein